MTIGQPFTKKHKEKVHHLKMPDYQNTSLVRLKDVIKCFKYSLSCNTKNVRINVSLQIMYIFTSSNNFYNLLMTRRGYGSSVLRCFLIISNRDFGVLT